MVYELVLRSLRLRSHFARSLSGLDLPVSPNLSIEHISSRLDQEGKLYDEVSRWYKARRKRRMAHLKIMEEIDVALLKVSREVDNRESLHEPSEDLSKRPE